MTHKHWNWAAACREIQNDFKDANLVHTEKWQGVDISSKPEMATYELLNYSVAAPVSHDLKAFAGYVKPNLPWADDHFEERVCGQPINPGIEWANWPFNKSADTFRQGGKFNHNYMERYWPRVAGWVREPTEKPIEYADAMARQDEKGTADHRGIYHRYGDLDDVINLLADQPLTRQAYIPIFFPEDTGVHHGGRVPCTLGYHLIVRNDQLHIVYFLRSCDFTRHFRDDVYLTGRLVHWALARLRQRDKRWDQVKPGLLTMHITSFHIFRNDYIALFGADK